MDDVVKVTGPSTESSVSLIDSVNRRAEESDRTDRAVRLDANQTPGAAPNAQEEAVR